MLDKEFVNRKIKLIKEEIEKISVFKNDEFGDIFEDPLKRDALERRLVRLITRATDINRHIISECADDKIETPKDYTETFLRLIDMKILPRDFGKKIAQSAGLRNRIAHDYNKIKENIVFDSIDDAINQYRQYCRYILEFLEEHE